MTSCLYSLILSPPPPPPQTLPSGLYTCSMTLQPMSDQQIRVLSVSMTNLLVKAGLEGTTFSGEHVGARLPIEPGLYSDQTEVLLSNLHPAAEFTVYGPAATLSTLEVRPGTTTGPVLTQTPDGLTCVCVEPLCPPGGVYLDQLCRSEGGDAQWFLQVHGQRCGPQSRWFCFHLRQQRLLWPESAHPGHFDSCVRRSICNTRLKIQTKVNSPQIVVLAETRERCLC